MAKQNSSKETDSAKATEAQKTEQTAAGETREESADKKPATQKKTKTEKKPVVKKAKKKPVKRSVPRHEQLKKQLSKKHVYVYYNGRAVYNGPGSDIGYVHNGLKIEGIVYKFDLLDIKIKD